MAKNEDSPAKLAILQEWDFWAKEHPEAASRSRSFLRIPEAFFATLVLLQLSVL